MAPARRVLITASALSALLALVMGYRLLFLTTGTTCTTRLQASVQAPTPQAGQSVIVETQVVTGGVENCSPGPSAWQQNPLGPTSALALILCAPPLLLLALCRTRAFVWLYGPVLALLLLGSFAGMVLPVFFAPAALPLLLGLPLAGLARLRIRPRRA